MDDVIRDLAGHHGRDDLSDAEVQEVKQTLSASYIDDILDSGQEIDVSDSAQTSTDGGLS